MNGQLTSKITTVAGPEGGYATINQKAFRAACGSTMVDYKLHIYGRIFIIDVNDVKQI